MQNRLDRCLVPLMAAAAGVAYVVATPAAQTSPYAGEETRAIKALSAQEIESLLGGKGMGFAKAAELNGYPGPAHVLELGDKLALTIEQRDKTSALFASMEREAIALGRSLVAAERELEALFVSRTATPEKLAAALARTADLQARLRGVHLRAHIEQTELLTPEQTARYVELRGYVGGASDGKHEHHGARPSSGHHRGHSDGAGHRH